MARASLLLLAALSVFALMQIGDGLKCYHCVEQAGGACDNPSKNDVSQKTCEPPANEVCITENTTLAIGTIQIVRDCGLKSSCNQNRANVNTTCNMCESDLCNSSSSVVPNFFIFGVVGLMFVKIFV